MRKRSILYLTLSIMIAGLSCQKIETGMPLPEEQQPENGIPQGEDIVKFITSIAPLDAEAPETRSAIDGNGKGEFVQGDLITLYVKPEGEQNYTKCFVMQWMNGDWKKKDSNSSLTWSDIGAPAADITAYYCFGVKDFLSPDLLTRSVEMDQNGYRAFEKSDYLTATSSCRQNEPVVLDFTHMMSLVEFNFTSRDGSYTQKELSNFKLYARAVFRFDLDTRIAAIPEVSGNTEFIIFKSMGKGKYRVLLPPQIVRENWKNSAWIDIHSGDRKISYKAPRVLSNGVAFDRLLSGKKVTFTLDLTKGNRPPVDEWANKTAWVYGLKDIPDVSQWGYYHHDLNRPGYNILGLTWDRKYGWYDCNKKYPENGSGPEEPGGFKDSNMCWAATASNLIYWWLDRNKENLDRYGKYTGPQTYNDALDCDVFEFFKKNFTNDGYYIENGLDFFFRGVFKPREESATLTSFGRQHHGFFTDIFGNDPGRLICHVGSGATMSEDLKNAFLNKEAVGVSIYVANLTGGHALTLWGAKFDENGDPCILYLVENNDRAQSFQGTTPMTPGKLCPAGIYEKRVIKKDGEYVMESSSPGQFTIPINSLIYLGTGQDEWNAYFAKTGK